MQSESSEIAQFSKMLYKDLENGDVVSFLEMTSESINTTSVVEFKRRMCLLIIGLKDLHYSEISTLFNGLFWSKPNMVELLIRHCFKMCERIPNIFMGFLYASAFSYSLLNYYQKESGCQFTLLFPESIIKVFNYRIKEEFDKQGGWEELYSFSKSNNIHLIIDFIASCYKFGDKLFTVVPVSEKNCVFGYLIDKEYQMPQMSLDNLIDSMHAYFKKEIFDPVTGRMKNETKQSIKQLRQVVTKGKIAVPGVSFRADEVSQVPVIHAITPSSSRTSRGALSGITLSPEEVSQLSNLILPSSSPSSSGAAGIRLRPDEMLQLPVIHAIVSSPSRTSNRSSPNKHKKGKASPFRPDEVSQLPVTHATSPSSSRTSSGALSRITLSLDEVSQLSNMISPSSSPASRGTLSRITLRPDEVPQLPVLNAILPSSSPASAGAAGKTLRPDEMPELPVIHAIASSQSRKSKKSSSNKNKKGKSRKK